MFDSFVGVPPEVRKLTEITQTPAFQRIQQDAELKEREQLAADRRVARAAYDEWNEAHEAAGQSLAADLAKANEAFVETRRAFNECEARCRKLAALKQAHYYDGMGRENGLKAAVRRAVDPELTELDRWLRAEYHRTIDEGQPEQRVDGNAMLNLLTGVRKLATANDWSRVERRRERIRKAQEIIAAAQEQALSVDETDTLIVRIKASIPRL